VNNCVGIGNHKLFLLFVFYIFLMCTYALLLVLTRYAGCIHSGGDDEISCGDGGCDGRRRLFPYPMMPTPANSPCSSIPLSLSLSFTSHKITNQPPATC